MRRRVLKRVLGACLAALLPLSAAVSGQQSPRALSGVEGSLDWSRVEEEPLRHFQTLVRFDTSDPPGNERPAADPRRDCYAMAY